MSQRQDLSRWDSMFEQYKDIPIPLRELVFSGYYLGEQLKKFGHSDDEIDEIIYRHGYESFGNDPWEKAEELLSEYN